MANEVRERKSKQNETLEAEYHGPEYSDDESDDPDSINKSDEQNKNTNTASQKESLQINTSSNQKNAKFMALILAVSAGLCCFYLFSGNDGSSNMMNKIVLSKHIDEVKGKFPSQSQQTWAYFVNGIMTMVDKSVPSTFLLLHNGNKGVAECIVSLIGNIIREILKKTEEPVKLFPSNEIAHFLENNKEITRYKSEIEKKVVVEIHDLEKFPGEIVKHFHSFCDVQNPIVKQAVFFFIMHTGYDDSKLALRASNTMNRLWNQTLMDNELQPLIIRLSDNIIDIKFDSSEC